MFQLRQVIDSKSLFTRIQWATGGNLFFALFCCKSKDIRRSGLALWLFLCYNQGEPCEVISTIPF